jgi:small neutral amino acid transporter SnatA (MarC family)
LEHKSKTQFKSQIAKVKILLVGTCFFQKHQSLNISDNHKKKGGMTLFWVGTQEIDGEESLSDQKRS